MRFSQYIGQEQLLADLGGAIARGRVGHAYLFIGPEGVGRATLAWLFAQALLCQGEEPPCDSCRSCQLVKAGTHPDLQVVRPDGATIRIEQMRAVRASVAHRPLLGGHRVYLLAEMERLSEAAANSFLLTLEEPPPGVVFIGWALAGVELLPTILSRCLVARLQPLAVPALAKVLVDQGTDARRAAEIAAASHGLPGPALHMLENETGQALDDDALLEDLLGADLLEIMRRVETVAREEREAVGRRLSLVRRRLHDEIVARTPGKVPVEHALAGLATGALWRLYEQTAQAEEDLRSNANIRLLLDLLALAFFEERAFGGGGRKGGHHHANSSRRAVQAGR